MKLNIPLFLCFSALLFFSCEPIVTEFKGIENCEYYTANSNSADSPTKSQIKVMTWNIRFGAGRMGWFGESCGNRVILTDEEVLSSLRKIADYINLVQPDILLLQEVDINSKRTSYIDQLRWIMDNTYFKYAVYASVWRVAFIPSDGLGRMDEGNAILSRWKIGESFRLQFPLQGDQDALTKYFYFRNNIMKVRIDMPDGKQFYAVNTHLSAFSTDDTKKKQVDILVNELASIDNSGKYFILGGDFNLLPPNSDSTDYCDEDKCEGESFHHPGDKPMHKDGSNYLPEITWMQVLYDKYSPDVSLDKYKANQINYFTHTTIHPNGFWNRKLDYLFTNYKWIPNTDTTHQTTHEMSDHCPVSVIWEVPK
ncbi:MAG: endonuclease/exonuclease/phosphatase family protein [Bacteroidota bacterium]